MITVLHLIAPATAPASDPRRFLISITRHDGTAENYQRTGGTSCDHALEALEAMELSGAGGVLRVVQVDMADAE